MRQQDLLLFCVLITTANFEIVDQKQFYVISTTQSPHESQNTGSLLKNQLEFCLRMEETNRRFSAIESQLQKSLDDEKSTNKKLSQELTRIETLLANEQKNHQEFIEKMQLHDQILASQETSLEDEKSRNEKLSQELTKIETLLANEQKNHQELIEKMQLHDQKLASQDKSLENEKSRNEKLSKELTRIETLLANEQKNHQDLIEKMHSYDQKLAAQQKAVESIPIGNNCKEIRDLGKSISGVYVIRPKLQAFTVFCDMETNGGGWIVFQRRIDGSQDFNLTWKEYKEGFGNLNREFWLGLEYLHQLTDSGGIEILIELMDRNHEKRFASYDNFSVGSEEGEYELKSLGTYSGTAGDSLLYHVGMKFFTRDKNRGCAAKYGGGWWFICYLNSNLNGVYFKNGTNSGEAQGINWYTFSTDKYSLLEARMMIRPK